MSIELTDGVPGTGKTMRNVKEIKELAERGEIVYLIDLEGDFPGLNVIRMTRNQKIHWLDLEDGSRVKQIVGEYIPKINTSSHSRDIPINFDWRDCEDGCYIFIDEAHYTFPATSNYNQAQIREDILDLSTHRHRGMNIRLMSQSPIQLHWFVHKQITLQAHLERVRGKEESRVFITDHYVEHKGNPKDADVETFKFDKSLYGIYSSAEYHDARKTRWDTRHLRMTKVAVTTMVISFLGVIFIYYDNPWGIWGNDVQAAEQIQTNEQVQIETPSESVALESIKTPLRVAEIESEDETTFISRDPEQPFGCIMMTETRGSCYYPGQKKELHYIDYKREQKKMIGSDYD